MPLVCRVVGNPTLHSPLTRYLRIYGVHAALNWCTDCCTLWPLVRAIPWLPWCFAQADWLSHCTFAICWNSVLEHMAVLLHAAAEWLSWYVHSPNCCEPSYALLLTGCTFCVNSSLKYRTTMLYAIAVLVGCVPTIEPVPWYVLVAQAVSWDTYLPCCRHCLFQSVGYQAV